MAVRVLTEKEVQRRARLSERNREMSRAKSGKAKAAAAKAKTVAKQPRNDVPAKPAVAQPGAQPGKAPAKVSPKIPAPVAEQQQENPVSRPKEDKRPRIVRNHLRLQMPGISL